MGKRQDISAVTDDGIWLSVIGRALAFQCLESSGLRTKPMGEQVKFLTALGLPRKDVAAMLDTSEESVRVQLSQKKKSKRESRTRG